MKRTSISFGRDVADMASALIPKHLCIPVHCSLHSLRGATLATTGNLVFSGEYSKIAPQSVTWQKNGYKSKDSQHPTKTPDSEPSIGEEIIPHSVWLQT